MPFEIAVQIRLVGEIKVVHKFLKTFVRVHKCHLQFNYCVVVYNLLGILSTCPLAYRVELACGYFEANMSLGVALLVELAKNAALAMPEAEIEIIEKHHNRKLDAPSGTALMIANEIISVRPEAYVNNGRSGQGKRTPEEIGIHAIRMGNIVGEHEVIVGTPNQTITLKHEAHSRALFAEGALAAAAFLVGCSDGLYDMKSLVGSRDEGNAVFLK